MPEDHARGGLHALPAWWRAAALLGVPSVIAMFLVYAIAMGLVRRVASIEATQQLQGRQLDTLAAAAEAEAQEARARQVTLERLLRQACVAGAATTAARAACLAP